MTETEFDVVVIGTGTAASVIAMGCRKAGRSVAVIDHRPFGGTCALRGCDPKKMLIAATEVIDGAQRLAGRGISGSPRIDWAALQGAQAQLHRRCAGASGGGLSQSGNRFVPWTRPLHG